MTKSEMIINAQQEMALEQMSENIATIAGDVSQLNLDVVTIREELKELREIVKSWKKGKKSGKAATAD